MMLSLGGDAQGEKPFVSLSDKDSTYLRGMQSDEIMPWPLPAGVTIEYREGCRSGKFRLALVDLHSGEVLDCEYFPFLLFPSQAVRNYKRMLQEAGVW